MSVSEGFVSPVPASKIGTGPGFLVQGQRAGILANGCQYVPERFGPVKNPVGGEWASHASGRIGDAIIETDPGVQAVIAKHLKNGTRLGRGVSSLVYSPSKRARRVLKLTVDGSYKWMSSLQGNPYAPKIVKDFGRVGTQEEDDAALYLVVVERLYELDGHDSSGASDAWTSLQRAINRFWSGRASERASGLADYARTDLNKPQLGDFFEGLAGWIQDYESETGEDIHLDLHNYNVMKRENGHLVVTDPIVPIYLARRARKRGRVSSRESYEESRSRAGGFGYRHPRTLTDVTPASVSRPPLLASHAGPSKVATTGAASRLWRGAPLRAPHYDSPSRAQQVRVERQHRLESAAAREIAREEGLVTPSYERRRMSRDVYPLPGLERGQVSRDAPYGSEPVSRAGGQGRGEAMSVGSAVRRRIGERV